MNQQSLVVHGEPGTVATPFLPVMEHDQKVTRKVLSRIARLTEDNLHGEALSEAAKALGRDDLMERMSSINRRHLALGHLSDELYVERRAVSAELFEFARQHLSKPVYQRLYGAM
jgi:hypothetical protein